MDKKQRTHDPKWKDNTRNERQARRREREKQWLSDHGYTSWEKLHTELMNGIVWLDKVTPAYSNPNSLTNKNALSKKKGKQS